MSSGYFHIQGVIYGFITKFQCYNEHNKRFAQNIKISCVVMMRIVGKE